MAIPNFFRSYLVYILENQRNLDLAAEKELTLADVLGEQWVTICNESIREQMAAAADPSVYFDEAMGGFTTVDENTDFYINADGDAVVVFPRATVAIGAMGVVEFVCADPTNS